jgi:Polysaccharide lyase
MMCLALVGRLVFGTEVQADDLPKGFAFDRLNGPSKPTTAAGETTFRIYDKQCSKRDYGDGRGESDCFNGNVRSAISARSDAKTGSTMEYAFEFWIDPSLSYEGYYNDHSIGYLPNAHDSRLRIASWEGEFLHNFIYMLKLDSQVGVSFLDQQCQAPQNFGRWAKFLMQVRWSSDEKGWIDVQCDGNHLYSKQNVATNQNPHCYVTNQCEKGKKKNPKAIHFIVGPVMAGFGFEWKKYGKSSQFTDIQKEGIGLKIRNVVVRKIKTKK